MDASSLSTEHALSAEMIRESQLKDVLTFPTLSAKLALKALCSMSTHVSLAFQVVWLIQAIFALSVLSLFNLLLMGNARYLDVSPIPLKDVSNVLNLSYQETTSAW